MIRYMLIGKVFSSISNDKALAPSFDSGCCLITLALGANKLHSFLTDADELHNFHKLRVIAYIILELRLSPYDQLVYLKYYGASQSRLSIIVLKCNPSKVTLN